MNRRARPGRLPGDRATYVAADFASRTMRWTGIIVLAFLVFHLADLTWGTANGSKFLRGDPYNNLIYSLRRPLVAIALHRRDDRARDPPVPRRVVDLPEPRASTTRATTRLRLRFAQGFAAVILIGNISFPIAVQVHLVKPECPDQRPPTAACVDFGTKPPTVAPAEG